MSNARYVVHKTLNLANLAFSSWLLEKEKKSYLFSMINRKIDVTNIAIYIYVYV